MNEQSCTHIEDVVTVRLPHQRACQECVKVASTWVHLRTCQSCGMTHCCDSSPSKHASQHARARAHPVVASAEPRERWLYCYPDDAIAPY
ncbi:MAG: UBP-type zinc finger domain-containing protein [Acidobacteria bacterium]|nr:UBP-type zinc finger domain-containing protein [Acidobacteriota bacterium]MCA1651344.1 UBP-type zinc finger domain-containing protein [Acidobacteriota bacterium]